MNIDKGFNKHNSRIISRMVGTYFEKMRGEKKGKTGDLTENIVSAVGGLVALSLISAVAVALGFPMVLGPIGASCLLVFTAHAAPFSQPRPLLGAHIISAAAALTIWDIFGRNHLTIGVTLAVVVFLMILLKIVHPPAAASAVVAINSQAGWGFLLALFVCSLLLIVISVMYNNLFKTRQYPKQWF